MTYDIPSILFGMLLGLPVYLLIDRLVYPFTGWVRDRRNGDE